MKIELYNVDDGGKKKMFNYVFDKPCQHFLLGPIVNEIFNVGTNCKIAKGTYTFFLDAHKMSQKFFGNNFFYGVYLMKTSVADTNCNLFCMILVSDFKKKVA
ncbi:hypothetical protein EVAR_95784_1 [Eumeta japonica]|uniref:Uncharacterized protein n=1 Tax=Eumeta variegata TaxID=151549 RepID=A0A4C1SJT2_EUMVA|nr:hypothetical protein EVAR_95784_1 [Eumeta japonica]